MLTCHLRAVSWQVFLEMLGRPSIMRRPCSNKFATRGGQLRKFIVAGVGDLSGSPGRFASHVSIALLAIVWFSTDRLSVGGSGGRGSGRFQLPSSRRPASQDAIYVWTVTVGPVLGNASPSVHVVAGGAHANRVLPDVIHDIMAPSQFRAFVCWTFGSKAASRSRVICVSKAIICIVRDINQAWRKVLWASESAVRCFGLGCAAAHSSWLGWAWRLARELAMTVQTPGTASSCNFAAPLLAVGLSVV